MKRTISSLSVNLLAAIVTFFVGIASESLSFRTPEDNSKLTTTVSATAKPPAIECPQLEFCTSNTPRIISMLSQLVRSKGNAETNTFYVKEIDDEQRGGRFTQVYWKNDRSILILAPPYDPETFPLEWTYSRRIKLDKDVVASDADVGMSNYLVTRAWIKSVLKDCVQNGVTVTITAPRVRVPSLSTPPARHVRT